jgi:hypothetical protein
VGDDLHIMLGETRKKGGLGASAVHGPGSACTLWQANVALSTHCATQQKCGVSLGWRNDRGSGWGRDFLRRCLDDRAECTSERESGYEQAPHSRSHFRLLTKVVAHLFVLQFSVLFQVLQTLEVAQTHNDF